MANLRFHQAQAPDGAIGPVTPVVPSQSPMSHVIVAAMLVSTVEQVMGTEMRSEVYRDGDREEGERCRNKEAS